jgi:ADP-heptose:LPS heptosyltransferase
MNAPRPLDSEAVDRDRRRMAGAGADPSSPLPGSVGSSFPPKGPLFRMRWIDHWIGLPVCFFVGVALRLHHRFLPRPDRPVRETGTVLVIKFFGLGSIMQATPLLRAVRARYPRARLVFLTFQENAGLLQRLDLCDELRVIRNGSPVTFFLDTMREVFWMRGRGVDASIDLEFFSKFSTLMAVLGGAQKRIGYHLNAYWRSSLLTHPVYLNYYQHIADVFAKTGIPIDVTVEDRSLSPVPVSDAARAKVREWLAAQGWGATTRLVGVNCNAGDISLERRWPVERFAEVIAGLVAKHSDVRVVLTGAPAEAEYVRGVWDRIPEAARTPVRIVAGVWSLDEFIAALGLMRCFVTNDSGPMHLAAAQGTPLVSLWGPARPDFYAPRVDGIEVIYENYPCSPCLFYMFTTFEGMWCRHEGWCMQAIAPARVLAAAERVLGRPELSGAGR